MAGKSARAEELAQQFEQVNTEVIAFVESCDDATWRATVPDEERSVGAVAAHVAGAYRVVSNWVRSVAAGQPVNITMDDIHAGNAKAAIADTGRSQADVLESLRGNGERGASVIRGLSDEELASSATFGPAGGTPLTAENVITYVFIRHPREHLAGMRKAAPAQ